MARRNDDDEPSAADKHRARMRERSRKIHAEGAELGELPAPLDPERRKRTSQSLLEDLVTYYPNSTGKNPFSSAHKKVIQRIEYSVYEGQDVWNMVFRGFAKTTITVNAASWALRNGHRKFIPLLAANKTFAKNLLKMLKTQLETNELLLEDYPEVCIPIRALAGKTNRCAHQTHDGEPTLIMWSSDEIMLPSIEGSAASGGIALAAGITGALNGMVRTLKDGRNVRPDWWLADDLQTRGTARSPTQIANRVDAIQHSVMMLGGHNDSIGGCINGTLFKPDDLMQQMSNQDLFPSFSGEVVPMVVQWPHLHEDFWLNEYARILKAFDAKIPGDRKRAADEATSLYRSRRKEADEGAIVTWEHCYRPKKGEISALQHAYNILILQGDEVFATECQQQVYLAAGETEQLCLTDVTKKLNGHKRLVVPDKCIRIVCQIDVQENSLWYQLLAVTDAFGGHTIDYGAWPEQGSTDVSKHNLRKTIAQKYKQYKDPITRVRAALGDLCKFLEERKYTTTDDREIPIHVIGVDVADGTFAEAIRGWCCDKENPYRAKLQPTMGIGITPEKTPVSELKKFKNEIDRGLNWYRLKDAKFKGGSIMFIDVNWWKSFVAARWRAASEFNKDDPNRHPDEGGAYYLYGRDPFAHTTFANHHLAELCDAARESKITGRKCDVWVIKNKSLPNEYLDTDTACAAHASRSGGIELRGAGLAQTSNRKRKKRTAAETRRALEEHNAS